MNIQDAITEGVKTGNAISRREMRSVLIPKNNICSTIAIVDIEGKRLPGKGWQPTYKDLMADDWYVTDKNYQNLIADM